MGLTIAFWILAVVAVLAGIMVVSLKNVFRAALALILCFLTVAGIYVTLSADFLAAIQILVYVGAISVLIILAIMSTPTGPTGSSCRPSSWRRWCSACSSIP
jgi:NADH-quinone oxidoreductase subunit J